MSNKNKTIDLNRTYFTMSEVAHLLSVDKLTLIKYCEWKEKIFNLKRKGV